MKSPGAIAGLILGIASAGLLAAAAYQSFEKYRHVLLWTRTEATIVDSSIGFSHDGEGRLRFSLRAMLEYSTPSGPRRMAAESDFSSLDFAAVRSRLDNLDPGKKIKAYYDPTQPEKVRFGAELSLEYLDRAAYYYAGAAVAAFLAAAIPLLWKPGRKCAACKTKLKHHYRYCTFCGAPVSGSPRLISNERPVET